MEMQLQIERAVLNSILFDPEQLDFIAESLAAEDFAYAPHQNIFAAMIELRHTDRPIDEEFILKLSTKAHPIAQEEILNILATNPISDLKSYMNEILEASIKRKLHSFAMKINQSTKDEGTSTKEIIDYLQSELYKITNTHEVKEFRDSEKIIESTLEYIAEMKRRGNNLLIGIDTGFAGLNKMTTGFNKGDLIIVAARPAMGKTTLVLNMAQKALDIGKGVAFFSLEMPAEQLMLRMLSAKTSIALQNLRLGNLHFPTIALGTYALLLEYPKGNVKGGKRLALSGVSVLGILYGTILALVLWGKIRTDWAHPEINAASLGFPRLGHLAEYQLMGIIIGELVIFAWFVADSIKNEHEIGRAHV